MAISLGCYDISTGQAVLDRFAADVEKYAGLPSGKLFCDTGVARFRRLESDDISGLQRFLVQAGFFPDGKVDGICGYRTQAAIRLFQEYVRHYEKRKCLPDGIAGPITLKHVTRWQQEGLVADWMPLLQRWNDSKDLMNDTSYGRWLAFLETLRTHYQRHPTPEIELVNKYRNKTNTRKPVDWSYEKDRIHLIGIRRKEQDEQRKFDDIFVLLVRGLVFKFQGSTDPGSTSNADGAPFLVAGQHDFRFGLHQGKYHALRPLDFDRNGVLVIRSKGDFKLSDKDLERGVQVNGTINIHWGGKGVGRPVNRWSEGCQVIAGSGYEDFRGNVVSCASYVATNNGEITRRKGKVTRGAYNVLSDLVIAMGSGLPHPGEISFTLLHEDDCQLDASIANEIAASLRKARLLMDTL